VKQLQELGHEVIVANVRGVGHIASLTFVLTLGSKQRFQRSRDVGLNVHLLKSGLRGLVQTTEF